RRASRRRARAPPVWSCPRPDRLARAGPTRAGPTRAAPLGWLRLAAVMGGTLVTHGGDIATACHQRPAHHAGPVQAGARAARWQAPPRAPLDLSDDAAGTTPPIEWSRELRTCHRPGRRCRRPARGRTRRRLRRLLGRDPARGDAPGVRGAAER